VNDIEKIQQIAEKAIKKIQAIRDAREEKEFRAGEWVPGCGEKYYFPSCGVNESQWDGGTTDMNRLNSVGVYPTIAIAEAAKAHTDWWRDFDMSDEGGEFEIYVSLNAIDFTECSAKYGNPKFQTEDSARAAIGRLGGEQKVIDMLTRGRVFRFKWGGE